MKHEHNDCEHELRYCKVCDVAYCAKCDREWRKPNTWLSGTTSGTITIPPYTYTTPTVIPPPTTTEPPFTVTCGSAHTH